MEFRSVAAGDLAALAAMAAPLQARPDRNVIYLGVEAAGIAAELEQATFDLASVVALDDGEVVGWLVGDVDEEMGRVWWLGPFVTADDWHALATELLTRARVQLPAGVTQEELAVDAEAVSFRPWAESVGFEAGQSGSWLLKLERDLPPSSLAVRPARPDDKELITLHERLFPNTHTTGEQLIRTSDEHHVRLIVERDDRIAGYVAVERQPDGSGYIDFLGVDDEFRRQGLGAELVRAGVDALQALRVSSIHLTVREDSPGARQLYDSLGFTAERLIKPYRIGFPNV